MAYVIIVGHAPSPPSAAGKWESGMYSKTVRVHGWADGDMRCYALLVSATQHGASCGVQVVKESGAGVAGAGCDGAESAADAVSAAPHLRRERVRWGVAMAVGSAPERGDGGEGAPSAR